MVVGFNYQILNSTDFSKNQLKTWHFLIFWKKTATVSGGLTNQLHILREISIFTVLFQKVSGIKKKIVNNDLIFLTQFDKNSFS